jgi:hypothetical protein
MFNNNGTPILNNVTMHTCQTCVIHSCDLITSEKDKVGVLDNKLNNFYNFNLVCVINLPTNPIMPMFFGAKKVKVSQTHVWVKIFDS